MAKPIKHHGKWRIRWVDHKGIRKSLCFLDYRTATYELKKIESEVEEIKRGLRVPIQQTKTFEDICRYWIENRLPYKKSSKDDISIINYHLRPFFKKIPLKNLTLEKVDRFTVTKRNLNDKTVSNILTLLISMLNVAVELDWLIRVPKIKKPKASLFSHEYRYLKTNEEISTFLFEAENESKIVQLLYSTAIYTGMRAGELAALRFSDLSFNGNKSLITVDKSYNGTTKSGKVRYVPILAPIYKPLLEWKKLNHRNDLVFPNQAGNMHAPASRIFQETLHRVLGRCNFQLKGNVSRKSRYIVFHDLRHTFASHWVINGGDIFKLQKILGHSSISMTMRYAHLSPNAFANDFERLGSNKLDFANIVNLSSRL